MAKKRGRSGSSAGQNGRNQRAKTSKDSGDSVPGASGNPEDWRHLTIKTGLKTICKDEALVARIEEVVWEWSYFAFLGSVLVSETVLFMIDRLRDGQLLNGALIRSQRGHGRNWAHPFNPHETLGPLGSSPFVLEPLRQIQGDRQLPPIDQNFVQLCFNSAMGVRRGNEAHRAMVTAFEDFHRRREIHQVRTRRREDLDHIMSDQTAYIARQFATNIANDCSRNLFSRLSKWALMSLSCLVWRITIALRASMCSSGVSSLWSGSRMHGSRPVPVRSCMQPWVPRGISILAQLSCE